ncbi:hypothetical protein [Rhodococcoides fascians]|uniref:hypothetical protein n=1 Tax=Rhodococcoides fascians TaxID=1828 RepID=UPI0012D2FDB4|nr:hypothetical protein [Rhodococcus fascians]
MVQQLGLGRVQVYRYGYPPTRPFTVGSLRAAVGIGFEKNAEKGSMPVFDTFDGLGDSFGEIG